MRYGKGSLGAGALVVCGALMLVGAPAAGAHAMSFAVTSVSVQESAGTVAITVNRTGSGTTPWVDYTTEDDTTGANPATAGVDYTATSGRLTFGPSEQQKTFSVPILDDAALEPDETVKLRLTAAGPSGDGHLGTPTVATLTILDDDSFSNFSLASYAVDESAGTATIGIVRTGHLGATDSVHYATAAGTATPDVDYTDVSGTATFAPGEVSKTFTVPILEDTADEPQESVNLALTLPSAPNHHVGSLGTAVLYINDNDEPAGPTEPEPTVAPPTDPAVALPDPPTVSAPPAATVTATAPPVTDAMPVVFATAAQSAVRRGSVGLLASCQTACSLSASGHVTVAGRRFTLRRAHTLLGAGHRASLRLGLTPAARVAVRRALAAGHTVVARVTVVSSGRAGRHHTTARTIRLTG